MSDVAECVDDAGDDPEAVVGAVAVVQANDESAVELEADVAAAVADIHKKALHIEPHVASLHPFGRKWRNTWHTDTYGREVPEPAIPF